MRINTLTRWVTVLAVALPLSISAQKGDDGEGDKSGSVAFKFSGIPQASPLPEGSAFPPA